MGRRSTMPTCRKLSNISRQPIDPCHARRGVATRKRRDCCEFAKSSHTICRKCRENSALYGNKGRFCRKALLHLRYQGGNIPRILCLASLSVSAGTGGSFYFVDSAETT